MKAIFYLIGHNAYSYCYALFSKDDLKEKTDDCNSHQMKNIYMHTCATTLNGLVMSIESFLREVFWKVEHAYQPEVVEYSYILFSNDLKLSFWNEPSFFKARRSFIFFLSLMYRS